VGILPQDKYEKLRQALNRVRTAFLFHGPMNAYQVEKHLKSNSTTIGRHLRMLVREKELAIYGEKTHWSGQIKQRYGFTFYGFLRSFRIPGAVTLKNFGKTMEIWLKEEKFQFFVPNSEALEGLSDKATSSHLARLCQLTANMFGDAEDFFEDIGYDFDPDVGIELALQLAKEQYGRRFLETSKVLCKSLPSYRKRIEATVNDQQARLSEFRDAVLGD
jgi:hypothetical protein